MKEVTYDSIHDDCIYTIQIGQNALDNWNIIDDANENDIWFHVENYPSCHIILKSGDKKPHKCVIKYCAFLCKSYSKYKSQKNIVICYTKISNVTKGDKIGLVNICNSKTITI